jgi:hypothetical protein
VCVCVCVSVCLCVCVCVCVTGAIVLRSSATHPAYVARGAEQHGSGLYDDEPA